MPLYRRVPKRGFKSPNRRAIAVLNLSDLERLDSSNFKEVSLETLGAVREIKGRFDRLAILGNGELTKAFTVKAHKVSAAAQEKILKAGGQVELLPIPGKAVRKAASSAKLKS